MQTHVTIAEAALLLGKSEQAIRNWIKRGQIEAEKLGWVWGIPKSEVERIKNGTDQVS